MLAAATRATYASQAGGCVGELPHYYVLLGGELNKWLSQALPKIRVQGDIAYFEDVVQARYEHGSWHLENTIW